MNFIQTTKIVKFLVIYYYVIKNNNFNHSLFQMVGNISFIIKDLQIHRPQLASTNRSYLQVNYIFLVFPSEIEPSLEDSNRRRLDNFPRKLLLLLY